MALWHYTIEVVKQDAIIRLKLGLSIREVAEAWRDDPVFREFFLARVSDIPFEAFFWETPPVTSDRLDSKFQCVFVYGPSLARLVANPDPFESKFRTCLSQWVTCFSNLGGDAKLVVPLPRSQNHCYPHLAAFSLLAPKAQQHAFWQLVGESYLRAIGHHPLWLSTAGLGVSWLHLRLDSRPKYYRFAAYKAFP